LTNRYDARYWLEHFLSVDAFEDENFITKKYLKFPELCQRCFFPAEDKKEGDVHESFCELFCQKRSI
jgi:hypothetical protein